VQFMGRLSSGVGMQFTVVIIYHTEYLGGLSVWVRDVQFTVFTIYHT
jgi:hypothetical protein